MNWNRRELLRVCLEWLARQTYPFFEVLVVDNGSSDGSPELVREMAAAFPVRLRLIANTINRGFCAANNQGMEGAEGYIAAEWIVLLNNDAEAEPAWLEALDG